MTTPIPRRSPGQKKSKKLPKRVGSASKKVTRERSWAKGQKRKEARRKKQEEAHRLNNLAASQEGKSETATKLAEWTNGRSEKWSRKRKEPDLSLRRGTMSRSVTVRGLRRTLGKQVINAGWQFACLNCPERKSFLFTHFPVFDDGFDLAYEMASRSATDHMCVPDRFRSAEENRVH